MPDIRVDLQVDGMGVRGHKMLINRPWQSVRQLGWAMAVVYNKPVEVVYREVPSKESEIGMEMDTWVAGRFVPDPDVRFIPQDVYEEIE
jgi:hypothetical protein